MISATQLRPGMVIKFNNELYSVFTMSHRTPGNLRGFVQVKMRSLRSGSMAEHRFTSDPDPALAAAVQRLLERGARIIAPAGSYPGNWPGVISVEGSARAGSLEGVSFAVAEETARLASRY